VASLRISASGPPASIGFDATNRATNLLLENAMSPRRSIAMSLAFAAATGANIATASACPQASRAACHAHPPRPFTIVAMPDTQFHSEEGDRTPIFANRIQ
jgi:hypothetical protein